MNATSTKIEVQKKAAALLSGLSLAFSHIDQKMLSQMIRAKKEAKQGDATKNVANRMPECSLSLAVVFGQICYLYNRKVNKAGIEEKDMYYQRSYTKLVKYYFPWIGRRQLMRYIAKLVEIGVLSVDRCNKDVNRYIPQQIEVEFGALELTEAEFKADTFILVFPKLTEKRGITESVILQRIHYMSRESGFIQISLTKLLDAMFNCISLSTLKRSLKILVEKGLLKMTMDAELGDSMIYTIDYGAVEELFKPEGMVASETYSESDNDVKDMSDISECNVSLGGGNVSPDAVLNVTSAGSACH